MRKNPYIELIHLHPNADRKPDLLQPISSQRHPCQIWQYYSRACVRQSGGDPYHHRNFHIIIGGAFLILLIKPSKFHDFDVYFCECPYRRKTQYRRKSQYHRIVFANNFWRYQACSRTFRAYEPGPVSDPDSVGYAFLNI